MRYTPCAQPGCHELIPAGTRSGKCTEHDRADDRARGSRQGRGYGAEHDRARASIPDAYGDTCIHCGQRMWPHERLVPDHTEDRSDYRGIVHASCNAREGAQRGNRDRVYQD